MITFCKRLFAFTAVVIMATGLLSCTKPASNFAEGQLWEATDSWLVIGKIDRFSELVVVSVTAYEDESLDTEAIAHLPFSQETFERSIRRLVRSNAKVSDTFPSGYRTWRKAFDAGEAGVW